MNIFQRIKLAFSVSTFFKTEIIAIVTMILMIGYFGILMLNHNYTQTLKLATENSAEQYKITHVNRNLFRFVLYEEKTADLSLDNVGIDSTISQLDYYKNEFLNDCEDSLIDKKKIDSLVDEKKVVIRQFYELNSKHIKVSNKLYRKDSIQVSKSIIKKTYKVIYKIDPNKLSTEVNRFDQDKNEKLNQIISDNFRINLLIATEVYKYTDAVREKMKCNGNNLIDQISKSIDKFLICVVVIFLLILFLIKILLHDLDIINRKIDRKELFIYSLLNRFKKK